MLQVLFDVSGNFRCVLKKGTQISIFVSPFRINFREFRFAQTMIFAIEEINNSSSLLPNISIGYKLFDTCGSTLPSSRAAMGLMNGQESTVVKKCSGQSSVQAVIGASESSSTIVMLQILGIFQVPVVNIWIINLFWFSCRICLILFLK